MHLTTETKIFIGIIGSTALILAGALMWFSRPISEVPLEKLVSKDAWTTGSTNPKAVLVEFSDFECPACGAAQPEVKKVIDKYRDKLKFVYRHFPLEQHQNARSAAEAAEAAGNQNKFWEMHDRLFINQTKLSSSTYETLAKELDLNLETFKQDLASGKSKDKVQRDLADGVSVGVNATPTFFLNGRKLNLFSFANLEAEINKVLE